VVQAALKMARHRCALSVTPDLLQVFEDILADHMPQHCAAHNSAAASVDSGRFLSINKMLLQNPAAAARIGKAICDRPRIFSRLSQQFHHNLSASLAETTTKSVQRVRRHARRVVMAEVRCIPVVWLDQLVNHCNIVSRCEHPTLTPFSVHLSGS
jgi:hypothetical protein